MKLPGQKKENRKLVYCIIEDDNSFRTHLSELLKKREDTESILEYQKAEDLLSLPELPRFDLLITDYRLPGMDGISLLGSPGIRQLSVPKMILSGFNAEEKTFEALKYGATGYIFKEEIDQIDSVLEILLSGGAHLTSEIALRIAQYFQRKTAPENPASLLTQKETDILKEFSLGKNPKRISEFFNISIHTVRRHIKNIYRKLEVRNQAELLHRARVLHSTDPD
ncbi:MAG TPA: response regulator transcription factor [Leptospiraceae bacterium]|nr:response regulator transcription factor [Leptospiraceae bacterium]